jgi:hypothetical protein
MFAASMVGHPAGHGARHDCGREGDADREPRKSRLPRRESSATRQNPSHQKRKTGPNRGPNSKCDSPAVKGSRMAVSGLRTLGASRREARAHGFVKRKRAHTGQLKTSPIIHGLIRRRLEPYGRSPCAQDLIFR